MTKSETFELEEFGEEDSLSETISLKIPENAKKGDYDLTIKAIFDNGEDEKTTKISILEKEPIELEPISLIKEKKPEKVPEIKRPQLEPLQIIPVVLFIGIIILIILIVAVALRKM